MSASHTVSRLQISAEGIDKDLEFLYSQEDDEYDPTDPDQERKYFSMCEGIDVPPKWPEKAPLPTIPDLIVEELECMRRRQDLSALQAVNREWCHAVRKMRFRTLKLRPEVDVQRLCEVFRAESLLPYVHHLDICAWAQDADVSHDWLNSLLPLIQRIGDNAHIDVLIIACTIWSRLSKELRTYLLTRLPHIRALDVYSVDFRNSNQFLRFLNAYPNLQYVRISDAFFWTHNQLRKQIYRTEPLLLTELYLGCAYTGLIMDWLLGERTVLAIEELTVSVRDIYRDDARLARVVKKISPWLKKFIYYECSGVEPCEGDVVPRDDRLECTSSPGTEPWDHSSGYDSMDWIAHNDEDLIAVDIPEIPSTADLPVAMERRISVFCDPTAHTKWFMEDDEGHNQVIEPRYGFPAWMWSDDYGYAAFAAELDRAIHTPMLEEIRARIHWKNNFSLLTLKMMCSMTYPRRSFHTFHLAIYFENEDVFDRAPWPEIDRLLSEKMLALPYEYSDDGPNFGVSFALRVATRGWDVRSRQLRRLKLQEVKHRMPETSRGGHLELAIAKWFRGNPQPGISPENLFIS
ncbi:hypothetical protein BV20DRAFT_284791 [Pilatotrama ljubarskyi]|nr:hypothetical protein BV20DRAFT_284791 [Pilatotrama ljubarskyi]